MNYYLLLLIIPAYFIGSISFGIVVAKFMNLGNLRLLGSGNIGATNVLRTGNKLAAALTLILDGAKGYLVIIATTNFLDLKYLPFTGLAVFVGHIFPIFLKFKGGKGVATFIGIILAVNPTVGVMVCATWLILAAITKKSSLAALGSSVATPLFLFFDKPDEKVLYAAILAVFIWWLHKDNIKRLISKTEPSIKLNQNPGK